MKSEEWISRILIKLVNGIPQKSAVLNSRRAFELEAKNSAGLLNVHPEVPLVEYNR